MMKKNERNAALIISSAIAAMLCFSLYFSIKSKSGNEDAIVVIKKMETTTWENTTTISAETKIKSSARTTKAPKTTKSKAERSKKDDSNKNVDKVVSEPETVEILWIDINTADIEELCKLPGIGEEIADRIVEYREENGEFLNIEEIMNVNGIGEKKFEDIYEYIYVENPVYDIEEEQEIESEEETVNESEPETEPEVTEILESEVPTIETTTEMEIITEEATCEETTAIEEATEDLFPIDLNQAGKEELMCLPYVTERIAERILQLRDDLEGFSNTYELLYVEELDQKEVAEILEFVTVGQ